MSDSGSENKKSKQQKQSMKERKETTSTHNQAEPYTKTESSSTPTNTEFESLLYSQLRAEHAKVSNFVFSPLSILMCMSMVASGTRGNSEKQLLDVLFPNRTQDDVLHLKAKEVIHKLLTKNKDKSGGLDLVNSVFVEKTANIKPQYFDILTQSYQVSLPSSSSGKVVSVDQLKMDFTNHANQCRNAINKMVSSNTHNYINELLPPNSITEDTKVVLVNCVYFKDQWVHKFKLQSTTKRSFHAISGREINVPTMHQTARTLFGEHTWTSSNNKKVSFSSLTLDYKSELFSMVFILPKEKNTIQQVESAVFENLESSSFGVTTEKLDKEQERNQVSIYLPKFKSESSFELTELFKSLGVTDVFNHKVADFGGMVEEASDLEISTIIHKAFIQVDEEGTTAAASTAAAVRSKSKMSSDVKLFDANRPFMFLLKHNPTNRILFSGFCGDPQV